MRESCTESDCFCGSCDPAKVRYNVWKDLTADSDPYGQTPPCDICGKSWAECNPFSGPHDVEAIQEHFEAYWITTAVALNYFGPTPKNHPFATPANVHDFESHYTIECLMAMRDNIDFWITELNVEDSETEVGQNV
jgi:hypothetical protein|tara:strand:+ start:1566 stop:1973 length:408 start_codon:yes stop_codon:yes gene_type:complete